MAFFQFFYNLSFLHTHISASSLESLGTNVKVQKENYTSQFETSISASPASRIITGVRSATRKQDLTETWKSTKERPQDVSQCHYREFIVTGKSTESRGTRSHDNLMVGCSRHSLSKCSYQSCIPFRKQQGKKYSHLFTRTFLNKTFKFMFSGALLK